MSENDLNAGSDVLDQAIASFRRMPVSDRPPDQSIVELLASHGRSERHFWNDRTLRPILGSRVFPYAAAAAAALAVTIWLLVNPSPSVALAGVIRSVERHQVVRYHQHEVALTRNVPVAPDRTVIADLRQFRIRSESRVRVGTIESVSVAIQDAKKDRTLHVDTDTETQTGQPIVRVALLEKVLRDDFKPLCDLRPLRPLLDELHDLKGHRQTTVSRDTLDGRPTLKYALQDEDRSITAWVDPETNLPIRMENEQTAPDGSRYRFIFSDFQWDPPVGNLDEVFSVEPPKGYVFRDTTRAHQPASQPIIDENGIIIRSH